MLGATDSEAGQSNSEIRAENERPRASPEDVGSRPLYLGIIADCSNGPACNCNSFLNREFEALTILRASQLTHS